MKITTKWELDEAARAKVEEEVDAVEGEGEWGAWDDEAPGVEDEGEWGAKEGGGEWGAAEDEVGAVEGEGEWGAAGGEIVVKDYSSRNGHGVDGG